MTALASGWGERPALGSGDWPPAERRLSARAPGGRRLEGGQRKRAGLGCLGSSRSFPWEMHRQEIRRWMRGTNVNSSEKLELWQ